MRFGTRSLIDHGCCRNEDVLPGCLLGFDVLNQLSDENDVVQMGVETVGGSVNINGLLGLPAVRNEVVYNLDFDLKFTLEDRSEYSERDESDFMGVKGGQLLVELMDDIEGVESVGMFEVWRG